MENVQITITKVTLTPCNIGAYGAIQCSTPTEVDENHVCTPQWGNVGFYTAIAEITGDEDGYPTQWAVEGKSPRFGWGIDIPHEGCAQDAVAEALERARRYVERREALHRGESYV